MVLFSLVFILYIFPLLLFQLFLSINDTNVKFKLSQRVVGHLSPFRLVTKLRVTVFSSVFSQRIPFL